MQPIGERTGRPALRIAVVLAVTAALGVVGGAPAQAASTGKRIAKLERTVKRQAAAIATLQSQLGGLQGQVGALGGRMGDAEARFGCINSAFAVTQYDGYQFDNGVDPVFGTTALAFTDPGDPADAFFVAVDPACVGSSAAFSRKRPDPPSAFRAR